MNAPRIYPSTRNAITSQLGPGIHITSSAIKPRLKYNWRKSRVAFEKKTPPPFFQFSVKIKIVQGLMLLALVIFVFFFFLKFCFLWRFNFTGVACVRVCVYTSKITSKLAVLLLHRVIFSAAGFLLNFYLKQYEIKNIPCTKFH